MKESKFLEFFNSYFEFIGEYLTGDEIILLSNNSFYSSFQKFEYIINIYMLKKNIKNDKKLLFNLFENQEIVNLNDQPFNYIKNQNTYSDFGFKINLNEKIMNKTSNNSYNHFKIKNKTNLKIKANDRGINNLKINNLKKIELIEEILLNNDIVTESNIELLIIKKISQIEKIDYGSLNSKIHLSNYLDMKNLYIKQLSELKTDFINFKNNSKNFYNNYILKNKILNWIYEDKFVLIDLFIKNIIVVFSIDIIKSLYLEFDINLKKVIIDNSIIIMLNKISEFIKSIDEITLKKDNNVEYIKEIKRIDQIINHLTKLQIESIKNTNIQNSLITNPIRLNFFDKLNEEIFYNFLKSFSII